jgi:hypothetical protein
VRELRRQHLDCDGPIEASISRAVNDRHPAAPDLAVYLVLRADSCCDLFMKGSLMRHHNVVRATYIDAMRVARTDPSESVSEFK